MNWTCGGPTLEAGKTFWSHSGNACSWLMGPALAQKMQARVMDYPTSMPKLSKTQKTPKGVEIPVPTRGEVYRDLAEMAMEAKPVPAKAKRGQSG